jgi:hypothetical protein
MKYTISRKLKSWLAMNNKKAVDLADYMGISAQSLNNKFARGTFTSSDLIMIAEFTGATLTMKNEIDSLYFGVECVREKESPETEKDPQEPKPDLMEYLNSNYSDDSIF